VVAIRDIMIELLDVTLALLTCPKNI